MPLPNNLDEAVVQAREATTAAIADGYARLQVELVFPELKIMPIAAQFLPAFEHLGDKLRVYFPDPGSAALARRDWGEKPYPIRGISDVKADIQPEEELFVFIEPSSVEVEQVEKLCEQATGRPVVMLNPCMEDIAIVGIGYAARRLRERFLSTFESCYYLQSLEGAAILRAYPSPWQVWIETEEGYELVSEHPQKPIGEELDQILAAATDPSPNTPKPSKKGILASLQQFLRALSQ